MAGAIQLGPELAWWMLTALVALLATVGAGVPLLQGRRVPSALLVAGPALGFGAAPLIGAVAVAGASTGVAAWEVAGTTSTIRLLAMLGAPVAVGLVGAALGYLGWTSAPRAPGVAAAVLVAGLLAAALPLASGWMNDDAVFAGFRAALDLVIAGVAAAAVVGASADAAAGTASVAPAVAALGYATVEAGVRGVGIALMPGNILATEPAYRLKAAEAFLAVATRDLPWQAAGLAIWSLTAVAVAGAAMRVTRGPGPLGALVAVPVAWWILLGGFPGAALLATVATP